MIKQMKRVALVAMSYGDLTVIYDRESERQDGSAYPFMEQLTKELNCVGLYVTNHDDSVLYYRLYKSGEIIDDYDSCPNYFDGASVPPEGGNAEILCNTFGVLSARERVQDILRYDNFTKENAGRYIWAIDRHGHLVEALGLPVIAVGFGYTYLAQNEFPEGLSPDNIISLPV